MKIDCLEFYINEIKNINYLLYLNGVDFIPETAVIDIYDDDGILKMGYVCDITDNNISFLLTSDITSISGYYKGIYTLVYDGQTYKIKIKINIKEI